MITTENATIDVMMDLTLVKDGKYIATFRDRADYLVERVSGEWFLVDGTGWREQLQPGEVVHIHPVVTETPDTETPK